MYDLVRGYSNQNKHRCWYYPLYKKKIEDIDCLDVQGVADKIRKPVAVLKEILDIPDFKSVCDKCEHRDLG